MLDKINNWRNGKGCQEVAAVPGRSREVLAEIFCVTMAMAALSLLWSARVAWGDHRSMGYAMLIPLMIALVCSVRSVIRHSRRKRMTDFLTMMSVGLSISCFILVFFFSGPLAGAQTGFLSTARLMMAGGALTMILFGLRGMASLAVVLCFLLCTLTSIGRWGAVEPAVWMSVLLIDFCILIQMIPNFSTLPEELKLLYRNTDEQ